MNKGIFIPIEVIENKDLSLTDKVVYAIYKYYTDNGNGCFLSSKRLSLELGISESTVKRSKRNLKDLGLIDIKRGRRSSTVSRHDLIHDPIVDPISDTTKQTNNEGNKSVLETIPDPISDPINEPLEADNKELGQNDPLTNEGVKELGQNDPLIGSNCTSKLGQNDPPLNKEVNKEEKTTYIHNSYLLRYKSLVKEKPNWFELEKEWKLFLEEVKKGNVKEDEQEETFKTFILKGRKTTLFPNSIDGWEKDYRKAIRNASCTPSKSCRGEIPNGLKEWVDDVVKKGWTPSQARNNIFNTPWSDYRDDVEHLMLKAGYAYTPYTDLPF